MKAEIWCEDCDTISIIPFEWTCELFDMVCPKCGSENIWHRDIESDEDSEPLEMGRGGCASR